eukprot:NODE_683_length_4785_cov_0.382202.p2 type:complete len:587 gc:universal NODE_683_length_4785_cov_0.382202:2528-768(-)
MIIFLSGFVIFLIYFMYSDDQHVLTFNSPANTSPKSNEFNSIHSKWQDLKEPFYHESCTYPFKVFLSEFDRVKFIECLDKIIHIDHSDSETFEEAVTFYENRYNKKTPSGFDKWFNFAKERGCRIDLYDELAKQIEFLNLETEKSYAELIEELIYMIPNNKNLKIIDILKSVILTNTNEIRTELSDILKQFGEALPGLRFVHNTQDSPFSFYDRMVDKSAITVNKRSSKNSYQFVSEIVVGLDIKTETVNSHEKLETLIVDCQLPFTFKSLFQSYGPFMSPVDAFHSFQLYPILSSSNYPCLTKDILIPDMDHFLYEDESDLVNWESKKDKLIWRGSTDGSPYYNYNNDDFHPEHVCMGENCHPDLMKLNVYQEKHKRGWFWNHRQRFVSFSHFYPAKIDAGFSSFSGMDKDQNRENKFFFWPAENIKLVDMFQFKYIFNIDGYKQDPRLLKYLRGSSLIFSSHFATSWFEEHLIPFYHYVPINPTLEDINFDGIPSSLELSIKKEYKKWFKFKYPGDKPYLSNPLGYNDLLPKLMYYRQNDELAHAMAINAMGLGQKYLTNENMDCYLFRVLLEIARYAKKSDSK